LCERDLLPPQSEASSGLGNFWTRSTGLREASSPSSVHDRDSQGCSNPRFNDRLAITRPSTVLQNVFLLGFFWRSVMNSEDLHASSPAKNLSI
jgi:hypothetical protein